MITKRGLGNPNFVINFTHFRINNQEYISSVMQRITN